MLNPIKLARPNSCEKALEALERSRDILIAKNVSTITTGDLYEISIAVVRALNVLKTQDKE